MKVVLNCDSITSDGLKETLISSGVTEVDIELFPENQEEEREAWKFFNNSDDLLDENGINASVVIHGV